MHRTKDSAHELAAATFNDKLPFRNALAKYNELRTHTAKSERASLKQMPNWTHARTHSGIYCMGVRRIG